jgi:Rad3-related DNA helicase
MRDRMGWFLLTVGMLIVAILLGLPNSLFAAAPPKGPEVRVDASKATPREVEEQTQQSIVRDYAKAWQTLEQSLEENRADLLVSNFAGYALDRWAQTVKAQKTAELSRRIVDHGHHLEVAFYSADGSAMQLRDTAQLEIQYLDKGKVIHKETMTARYLVLMTPAENSWKVRILQEIAPETPKQASLNGVSEQGTASI